MERMRETEEMKVEMTWTQEKAICNPVKFLKFFEIGCANASTLDHDQVERRWLQKGEIFEPDLAWSFWLSSQHNTTKIAPF